MLIALLGSWIHVVARFSWVWTRRWNLRTIHEMWKRSYFLGIDPLIHDSRIDLPSPISHTLSPLLRYTISRSQLLPDRFPKNSVIRTSALPITSPVPAHTMTPNSQEDYHWTRVMMKRLRAIVGEKPSVTSYAKFTSPRRGAELGSVSWRSGRSALRSFIVMFIY